MPKRYRNWTESDMERAVKLVKSRYSKREAAHQCEVPRSTLWDRINGRKPERQGKQTKLSTNDEKELVNYAVFMADSGAPVTPQWMRETAGRLGNERYFLYISLYIFIYTSTSRCSYF